MALHDITSVAEFDAMLSDTANTDKVLLVDFWAEWCGPCRLVGPILHDIAEDAAYADTLHVLKVDVDKVPELADRFHIQGIPTMMFFKNNEKVEVQVGAMPKEKIVEIISKHLA